MISPAMKYDISTAIKYIGVDDLDLDLFESQYVIPNGVSYNSYLIVDHKVAIMDTVDHRKEAEWLRNLDEELGGRTPDYLVVQHLEPDHAGCIASVVERYPSITIVASTRALQMLPQFFDGICLEGRTIAVKEGDSLALGEHTLHFVMAPMVHWPEVMVSYESSEKVLFSADGFGKFGALCKEEDWACEARRYYFNICGKYGGPVQVLLKKAAGLDIETIAPLHGPILRDNLGYYIGLYDTWSKYEVETDGVLVAYASIHGNTAAVAREIAELLRSRGVGKVVVTDLCRDDMAEAVEDAFRMGGLVLAAASYDGGLFPPMYDFLHHLSMKAYKKRKVAIVENGSWAPTAGRVMQELVAGMCGVEVVAPVVTIWSRMKESDRPQLESLADSLAAALKEGK